ncbi:MAG: STAS domain-containing protein [Bacteroidota bacterium]
MEIKQILADTYTTLIPVGDLDASSSVYLDEVIRSLIDEGTFNVHVDFGETRYISSAGMGVFISYIEEIQQNQGKMVLSNMTESVKDSFELLGLHQLITIVAGKEEVEKLYT